MKRLTAGRVRWLRHILGAAEAHAALARRDGEEEVAKRFEARAEMCRQELRGKYGR